MRTTYFEKMFGFLIVALEPAIILPTMVWRFWSRDVISLSIRARSFFRSFIDRIYTRIRVASKIRRLSWWHYRWHLVPDFLATRCGSFRFNEGSQVPINRGYGDRLRCPATECVSLQIQYKTGAYMFCKIQL